MDWLKAKKILIVALLITNLILFGFILYNGNLNGYSMESKKFVKETVELLSGKNIELDTKIPKKGNKLPTLIVEFEVYDPEKFNIELFDGKGKIEKPSTNLSSVSYEKELLTIINNRRLIYENTGHQKIYSIEDFSDVKKIVDKFFIKMHFKDKDMELDLYKKENGKHYLFYSKVYEGINVERSYTNIIVDETGVVSMDRLWLNVSDVSNTGFSLMPACKALLVLLDEDEYYNRKIIEIRECYYFDPEEQGYVEDITKAMRGRAVPAWRIKFEDGENVEIDNF